MLLASYEKGIKYNEILTHLSWLVDFLLTSIHLKLHPQVFFYSKLQYKRCMYYQYIIAAFQLDALN